MLLGFVCVGRSRILTRHHLGVSEEAVKLTQDRQVWARPKTVKYTQIWVQNVDRGLTMGINYSFDLEDHKACV